MKIFVTKKYYARTRRGREPIRFKARQKKVGSDVHATIVMDPILKKHSDLRKALLAHEKREISSWGRGKKGSHLKARKKEPKKLQKIGGVTGFWKEIKRREKGKG